MPPLNLVLWTAIYVTANIVGVYMLQTTLVTPMTEIAQPALMTLCSMGIAAVSMCRMLVGWRAR